MLPNSSNHRQIQLIYPQRLKTWSASVEAEELTQSSTTAPATKPSPPPPSSPPPFSGKFLGFVARQFPFPFERVAVYLFANATCPIWQLSLVNVTPARVLMVLVVHPPYPSTSPSHRNHPHRVDLEDSEAESVKPVTRHIAIGFCVNLFMLISFNLI